MLCHHCSKTYRCRNLNTNCLSFLMRWSRHLPHRSPPCCHSHPEAGDLSLILQATQEGSGPYEVSLGLENLGIVAFCRYYYCPCCSCCFCALKFWCTPNPVQGWCKICRRRSDRLVEMLLVRLPLVSIGYGYHFHAMEHLPSHEWGQGYRLDLAKLV